MRNFSLAAVRPGLLAVMVAAVLAGCGQQASDGHAAHSRAAVSGTDAASSSGVAVSGPAATAAGLAASGTTRDLRLQVCGEDVHYPVVPRRAVTNDMGITEMFLFLGLEHRLAGFTGIRSHGEIDPAFQPALKRVPDLSSQGLTLENLLGVQADFVFAGWNYGFREGGVTPAVLQRYGISSYALTESCVRIQPRQGVAIDDTLRDLRNIARIFDVEVQTEARIRAIETDLHDLRQRMQGVEERPRVFLYDGGEKIPTTVGRYGMARAIIDLAGGENLFDDIASNWPRGNWEDVVARDPAWIVINDYGTVSAQAKIDFLRQKPELANVDAIRNQRFFVISYAEATPGPRNVKAARALAQKLHPERFGMAATAATAATARS